MHVPTPIASRKGRKPRLTYGFILLVTCLFLMAIVSALISSFGVFFKPMLDEFGWTRAATSGPYSLLFIIFGLVGFATGRASDRFGPRWVVTFGGIFEGSGLLLMSRISSLWQLYLFFGVLVGIGQGCVYVPIISVLAKWFAKRRGLMTGIAMSGAGLGTAIGPPVATQLMAGHDWRTSLLIFGVAALILIMLLAQLLKSESDNTVLQDGNSNTRVCAVTTRQQFSLGEAFCTRHFVMLCGAWFLYGFCSQTGLLHIVPYATDLGMSAIAAATVLTIVGVMGIFGRVGTGLAADRFGNRVTLVTGLLLTAAAYFALSGSSAMWILYLFGIIYGFFSPGPFVLMSPIVAEFFGLKALGTIVGAINFATTIGSAVGPVVAGHIFDATRTYHLAFILCGTLGSVAGLTMWLAKPKH